MEFIKGENVNNVMGSRIKERREELGITQDELAKFAGYATKSSISLIEAGKVTPPVDKLLLISKCLDCEPSDFMEVSDFTKARHARLLKWFDEYINEGSAKKSTPIVKLSRAAIEINNLIADLPENEQWKLVGRIEAYVERLNTIHNEIGDQNEKI